MKKATLVNFWKNIWKNKKEEVPKFKAPFNLLMIIIFVLVVIIIFVIVVVLAVVVIIVILVIVIFSWHTYAPPYEFNIIILLT